MSLACTVYDLRVDWGKVYTRLSEAENSNAGIWDGCEKFDISLSIAEKLIDSGIYRCLGYICHSVSSEFRSVHCSNSSTSSASSFSRIGRCHSAVLYTVVLMVGHLKCLVWARQG